MTLHVSHICKFPFETINHSEPETSSDFESDTQTEIRYSPRI